MIIEQMYHLFPFQLIEKDAEIILYGYGNMGQQYAEQLAKTGYCRVKYIVDQRWKELEDSFFEIKDPNVITEEEDPTVVITTDRFACEIKCWLLSIGVQENKIISQNIELEAYSRGEYVLQKEDRCFLENVRELISIMDVVPKGNLVRIGKNNDGGYLMLDDFVERGGVAYSLGIAADVSWDKDMADRGYDIFMYDHTINALPEDNVRFHWKKVGVAADKEYGSEFETLEQMLDENGHSLTKEMILKMDVEGAEWGCFSMTSTDTLDQFDQIVLELHQIIEFWIKESILEVLKKINQTHQCIHVHLNNYSSHIMVDSVPYADSIEVTFVNRRKYSFVKSSHYLPHEKDQPCNPLMPELILRDYYRI